MNIKPIFLPHWAEGVFTPETLHEEDGHLIARGGKVALILPLEMAPRLNELIGKRIGILRCDDGFRLRTYEDKSKDQEA
jgi:hypothetical protein